MRAHVMPASRPFACALASALLFACVEPDNVAQPASPTQPLVEVRPSPGTAARKPGPGPAGGPSVATRYQDDWFGGVTLCGVGQRHGGAEGIRAFTQPQAMLIEKRARRREPVWFPYQPKRADQLERLMGFLWGGW